MPSHTARIAKNTLMLYFRQILIMLVSLYTVRVVLNTLGAEDYVIYNVVAGVVAMFGFLSGSMATASQRYFAFEIGRGDYEQLKRVFSLSLTIYLVISVLVLLLAETVGIWFIVNKLVIPAERKSQALWVYHFSIVSFLFTIITTPYMAMIVAHEDMNIYAFVSIVEAFIKLGIVFILQIVQTDKLWLYGILACIATMANTAIYRTICIIKYKDYKFKFYWDRRLFKEIMSFTGWNIFGSTSVILKFQAMNIMLNQFFNPTIVAARSIAININSAVSSFFQNFTLAIRPQITKSYAINNVAQTIALMIQYTKITFFLIYTPAFPLMLEMPTIFSIWLKDVPKHAVPFTQLILIDAVVDSLNYPTGAALQATGKIKLYQTITSGILLLNLPISWAALKSGAPVHSVFVIAIFLSIAAFVARVFILKHLIKAYSIYKFIKNAIMPIVFVFLLSAIFPVTLHTTIKTSLVRLFLVILVGLISSCGSMYFIGLNKDEKKMLKAFIISRFSRQ
jgi:O-antigen/teichoic acid export membrane protein